MERHFTIHVDAWNDHAVLQRILLAFSRRRLRVRALRFFDPDPLQAAQMQLELCCLPEQAQELVVQLRGIVEVTHAWSRETPGVGDPGPSPTRLAAA